MEKKNSGFKKIHYVVMFLLVAVFAASFVLISSSANNVQAKTNLNQPVFNGYIFEELQPFDEHNSINTFGLEGETSLGDYYCLRDDYVIYTQDQLANGLCWAYSGSMALSTTLMKATGQYYDFSEAWISLANVELTKNNEKQYVFGDGGNFGTFNEIAKKYGLVLESDFHYEDSFLISNSNYSNYYNYYSQFANKEIMNAFELKNYVKNNTAEIKQHIYKNGGLNISMHWNDPDGGNGLNTDTSTYKYKFPNSWDKKSKTGHALTIIGWDDNFSKEGLTGAWICLNSWGDSVGFDGVCYVFYDDTDVYGVGGYEYNRSLGNNLIFDVETTTGYSYTTNLAEKYNSKNNYTATQNNTKQKNVFFDKNVSLTYQYAAYKNNGSSAEVTIDKNNISVFYGQEEVSYKFNIDVINKKISIVVKDSNSINVGAYKVLVPYTYDGKLYENLQVFYVMDKNELSIIRFSNDCDMANGNGVVLAFSTYNYSDLTFTISTTQNSGKIKLLAFAATYSIFPRESYMASEATFSENEQTVSVTFVVGGNSIKINFIIVYVEKVTSVAKFYYNLDGGTYSQNKHLIKNNEATLKIPTKPGFVFDGWYYDKSLTEENKLKNGNVFDCSKLIATSGNRYAENYYNGHLENIKVAFVYAKWEVATLSEQNVTVLLDNNSSAFYYGKEFSFTIDVDGSLKDLITIGEVSWYLAEDSLLETSNGLVFSYTIDNNGEYENGQKFNFKAEISPSVNGVSLPTVTKTFSFVGLDKISADEISSSTQNNAHILKWEQKGYTSFQVEVFDEQNNKLCSQQTTNATFDLSKCLKMLSNDSSESYQLSSGKYYIKIQGSVQKDGINYVSEVMESEDVDVSVFTVTFETKIGTIEDSKKEIKVLSGEKIENLIVSSPEGYKFEGWYKDETFKEKWNFDTDAVMENITLHACLVLDAEFSVSDNINKEYNAEQETLEISSVKVPQDDDVTITYQWYKDGQIVKSETERTYIVKNVKDSGSYYCEVTVKDEKNGLFQAIRTNNIEVKINQVELTIDVSGIESEHVYNTNGIIITQGAKLKRGGNDFSTQELTLNYKFKDGTNAIRNVGTYILTVSTNSNDNYKVSPVTKEIKIFKSNSSFTIHKPYQFFKYIGKEIVPEFVLNNTEQVTMVKVLENGEPTEKKIVNAGEYDVRVTALASDNYESVFEDVHVTVNPANIHVKIHNVFGVLFAKQQKEFSYSIIKGELFNDDELNIKLSANNVQTGKIGTYAIDYEYDNPNYKVAFSSGKYYVSGLPYYVGGVVLCVAIYFVIRALRKRRYQYDFETNGGSIVSPIDTRNKHEINLETPAKEGYKFVGWFSDEALTKPAPKKFVKSKGKVLYAKWEKVDETLNMTEELKIAERIVNDIQKIVGKNNKQDVQENNTKQTELENLTKQTELENNKPKEKSNSELMQEFIGSVENNQNFNADELKDFINKIVDKK